MGGIALHQGCIAEMRTGEGKTLTATMPLYLNALMGKGAILVTTNAYLAVRDGEEMGKVYQFLGLTVGIGAKEEEDTDTNQDSEEDRKVSIWQILPIQLVQHLVSIISLIILRHLQKANSYETLTM